MDALTVDELFGNTVVIQTMNPVLVAQLAVQALQAIDEETSSSRTVDGVRVTVEPDGEITVDTSRAKDLEVWKRNAGTFATITDGGYDGQLVHDTPTRHTPWMRSDAQRLRRNGPAIAQMRTQISKEQALPGDQEIVYYPGIDQSLFFAPWSTRWNGAAEGSALQPTSGAPKETAAQPMTFGGVMSSGSVHDTLETLETFDTADDDDDSDNNAVSEMPQEMTVNIAAEQPGYICEQCGASSTDRADFYDDDGTTDWCSCGAPQIVSHRSVYCENCDTLIFVTPQPEAQ